MLAPGGDGCKRGVERRAIDRAPGLETKTAERTRPGSNSAIAPFLTSATGGRRSTHLTWGGLIGVSPCLLKKLLELFDSETSVTNDAAHREFVDWVVARNRENTAPVTHHKVLTLADDLETGLLQSTNGP